MKRHRGSFFWSLILISIGMLFLLKNLQVDINPWMILAKYWPLLIIFWGLSKLVGYFSSSEDPASAAHSRLTGGDVVLLLFLLIVGTVVTKAVTRDFWPGSNFGVNWDDVDFNPADVSGDNYTFVEETSLPLSKKDRALEVNNVYGSMEVKAHDRDEIKIRLEKRVRAKDEAKAKEGANQVKVRVEAKSPGFVVSTNREELDNAIKSGLKTNFQIWVPRSMALNLSNKYGPVTVENVAGNHKLQNSYGDITLKDIDGNVQVDNKYGAVNLTAVSGDCKINSKYGGIELESIGGKTAIDHGYGSIVLRKIKGAVELSHRNGQLECNDLESGLTLDGRYVEVRGNHIGGDVQVVTSYRNVELKDVEGTIKVQGKHGDVNITSQQAPSKPITVDSEYGNVTIALPGESRFRFDGYSNFGRLVSDFDSISGGSTSNFVEGARIKGSHGEGGPMITVTTSYRDIHLGTS